MMTPSDCDKLLIYNGTHRTTTKKAIQRYMAKTFQVNQTRVIKKCSSDPQEGKEKRKQSKNEWPT